MSALRASFLALAAVLLAAPALGQPAVQGPTGSAFYIAPDPLPDGAPGTVIWSRPLTGTMALPGAAKNLLVLYRSTSPEGGSVAVSGTMAVPAGAAPAGGWPVIVWMHGTTGLGPQCAPSLDDANGPEHGYIQEIQTLLAGFLAQGYAVVATDYQGLGTPGPHPFLQGIPNGRNGLDMLRAARAIEPAIGAKYAVVGHSQGGQADLFAASQGPFYAPELTLVGNVAFAPGSQIADRLAMVMKSDKVELSLPYVLYVLVSYAGDNPDIDLSRILTSTAVAHLPDLLVGCMSHALTTGYWSTAIAKDQFLPNPDLAALLKMAAQNEPGTLAISGPTLIAQGTGDVTVLPAATDATVASLCASGNAVLYRTYKGASHDGVMVAGAADARDWVKARFAGEPEGGNCLDLPSAAAP